MDEVGWHRRLDDPITVDGRTLRTLRDAADYIVTLPEWASRQQHWQTAVRELMMAAERGRIMIAGRDRVETGHPPRHRAARTPQSRQGAHDHRVMCNGIEPRLTADKEIGSDSNGKPTGVRVTRTLK
jgi:hypothetical protein